MKKFCSALVATKGDCEVLFLRNIFAKGFSGLWNFLILVTGYSVVVARVVRDDLAWVQIPIARQKYESKRKSKKNI